MEAALYAVPVGYVKHLSEEGSAAGRILSGFKDDMRHPISAILIFNTLANTTGASIAGWAFAEHFGSSWLGGFSAAFTLAILYGSEIIPKMIGVTYCRSVSQIIALPLFVMIKLTTPLIWISIWISSALHSTDNEPSVSGAEVLSMAALGTEEGALDHLEGSVISNIIELDKVLVREILTPRVVVFRVSEDMLLKDVSAELASWSFSRIPLFSEADPDVLTGYVTQREIFRELLKGQAEGSLKSIARPLDTVPELMRADKLLLHMVEKKEHICAVVDEHGGLAGIVTLEDVIEEVVGREIVDEYDTVSDLRSYAKVVRAQKAKRRRDRGQQA